MKPIHIYFRTKPEPDRFIPGDKYIVSLLRQIIRGAKTSGVKKVFINLCKGFDLLDIKYTVNLPFHKIEPGEPVVVLGDGPYALEGYNKPNPIIAGIGLMTHPAEWPALFKDYPIAKYLQHSDWANNIYIPYYGENNCLIWPSGVDTDYWAPNGTAKKYDFLVYDKVMWPQPTGNIVSELTQKLASKGYIYKIIRYGGYKEVEYYDLLQQSRAILFLCEHESQGFACCEAMSMNVPVFAWDQGFWLDPNRFKWGTPVVKATSIPFFDNHCGLSFKDMAEFDSNLNKFWTAVSENKYNPRAYILNHLTLKKSALVMLKIITKVYPDGYQ